MSENARFTAKAAADVLAEASTYEEALRQRTEGLTWMIWGIVTPAIWLSYGFAGATLEGDWPAWTGFLWAPWVFVGVLTTVVLWRSARLSAPRITEDAPPGWRNGLLWAVITMVIWSGIAWGVPVLNEALIPLLVVSAAWLLFGLFNWERCSTRGRRVSIAIGAATLAVGVVLAFVAPGQTERDYVVATLGAVVATSVFPLSGGLWQALRG